MPAGAAEARAKALGLTPFNHADHAPGRRFYIFDDDGIEWEIVSYASAAEAGRRSVSSRRVR